MKFTILFMKFMISIMIVINTFSIAYAEQGSKKCLAPGEQCYQATLPCCTGYKCASGPVSSLPKPTDRCISNQIIG